MTLKIPENASSLSRKSDISIFIWSVQKVLPVYQFLLRKAVATPTMKATANIVVNSLPSGRPLIK